MITNRNTVRALAALLLGSTAACYSYRPITPAELVPDDEIRVMLTPDETLRQQASIGVLRQRLEGRYVAGVGDDLLGLVVPQPQQGPSSPRGLNTMVTIRDDGILQIDRKRFSVAKTGLLAAAGAVVVVAVLAIADASSGEGGETPPDNSLVSIPFRLIFR